MHTQRFNASINDLTHLTNTRYIYICNPNTFHNESHLTLTPCVIVEIKDTEMTPFLSLLPLQVNMKLQIYKSNDFLMRNVNRKHFLMQNVNPDTVQHFNSTHWGGLPAFLN